MASDQHVAIQFEHVHYSTDDLHILKDITGSFIEGAITTLVGPSGAGKSTLFQLCNGLKSPSKGEIYIKDKLIDNYDPIELRRKVGIALQKASMVDGTVEENLALPLKLKGESLTRERGIELLQLVGLNENFLSRDAKDLSGGQRQKLSIARTLVNRPKILLLDEITSSLDRVSQQDIEHLIKKINQTYGTTMIWITHNLQQARSIGHYSWVMMEGELIETGESQFLDNPTDKRVKQFVKGEER